MNLDGITAKITSNADLLGKLYGYLGPMANIAINYGEDPISCVIRQHEEALNAVMQGKIPDLRDVIDALKNPVIGGPILKNGFLAWLVGQVGGDFIGERNASALRKFGVETMKYSVLSSAVSIWGSVPQYHGSHGGSSRGSGAPVKVS